jgi:hypothetical protein
MTKHSGVRCCAAYLAEEGGCAGQQADAEPERAQAQHDTAVRCCFPLGLFSAGGDGTCLLWFHSVDGMTFNNSLRVQHVSSCRFPVRVALGSHHSPSRIAHRTNAAWSSNSPTLVSGKKRASKQRSHSTRCVCLSFPVTRVRLLTVCCGSAETRRVWRGQQPAFVPACRQRGTLHALSTSFLLAPTGCLVFAAQFDKNKVSWSNKPRPEFWCLPLKAVRCLHLAKPDRVHVCPTSISCLLS